VRTPLASAALVLALGVTAAAQPAPPDAEATADAEPAAADSPADDKVAAYFAELGRIGLIDAESGDKDTLTRELRSAERLLRDGDPMQAAVALYAIVESPRYDAFRDFVEYQNAEYDLAIALVRAGAFGRGLDILERILARGPAAPYWGPAHRRAVDLAIDTRDHQGVLGRIEAIRTSDPIPPSAAGERAYLRGRALYDQGKFGEAEDALVTISKKSRMYSSAIYLRGVIKTRKGDFKLAAEAMCEIAATPDDDKFTFVVDDRYFTLKDLARLGLARIAHEQGEYDDAYYHYFQVPEDSVRLSDALFEAAWSMYQKRELATARDLAAELLTQFPTAPTWPEASLLAGYVELADCKFDDSRRWYDQLVKKLQPIVDEMDRVKKDPTARAVLFERALARSREQRDTGKLDGALAGTTRADSAADEVLALLQLEPQFFRLHEAVVGLDRATGEAPGIVRTWQGLARRVGEAKVGAASAERTIEEEDAADASALAEDYARLGEQVERARADLAAGRADGTVPADVAADEDKRLAELAARIAGKREQAQAAASTAAEALIGRSAPALRPLIAADVAEARRLDRASRDLRAKVRAAADTLAQRAVDRLYVQTRRVLDKAKLGTIDAVIGQKRKLDIEVSDLAAGRLPPELHGRLWEAGLIGDDEEFWPFQGEFWADEYEGWR
jgi:hypothetical protein